tara:strand:- start:14921 stop:15370 length:450 start_codon:yes stop_codon:yes gene_type:complete
MFKLSSTSSARLIGVNKELVGVVEKAIKITNIDFGVTCGMRTREEQQALVDSGASQTMNSKHLEGNAVDVVAYIGSRITWELNVYDDIADAFKSAAQDLGVGIRWGAAWQIPDIRDWDQSMEAAMNAYVDLRRGQGKRPFIDAPHFELA